MTKYKVGDKLVLGYRALPGITRTILMVGNASYFVEHISLSGSRSEISLNIQDLDTDENWNLYKEPRLVKPRYVMVVENIGTDNLYIGTDTFASENEARRTFERWRSTIVKLHDVIEINYEETPK